MTDNSKKYFTKEDFGDFIKLDNIDFQLILNHNSKKRENREHKYVDPQDDYSAYRALRPNTAASDSTAADKVSGDDKSTSNGDSVSNHTGNGTKVSITAQTWDFKVGDLVLWDVPAYLKGDDLEAGWQGPFEITTCDSRGCVTLKNESTGEIYFNGNPERMKLHPKGSDSSELGGLDGGDADSQRDPPSPDADATQ